MQSTSVMNPMTGLPEPQLAIQAVGMPATPRSTLKPFFSSIAVTYRDVSTSWNPSSLKLKIWSTICWMSVCCASTSRRPCALISSAGGAAAREDALARSAATRTGASALIDRGFKRERRA